MNITPHSCLTSGFYHIGNERSSHWLIYADWRGEIWASQAIWADMYRSIPQSAFTVRETKSYLQLKAFINLSFMLLAGVRTLSAEVCWPFLEGAVSLCHRIHPVRCLTKSEKQKGKKKNSISYKEHSQYCVKWIKTRSFNLQQSKSVTLSGLILLTNILRCKQTEHAITVSNMAVKGWWPPRHLVNTEVSKWPCGVVLKSKYLYAHLVGIRCLCCRLFRQIWH